VLADGRGPQQADRADGRIVCCSEPQPDWAAIVWRSTPRPGLAGWERQLLLRQGGPLLVVDVIAPEGAAAVSVPWHLHAAPELRGADGFATDRLSGRILANRPVALALVKGHPRPCVRIDAAPAGAAPVVVASLFGTPEEIAGASADWPSSRIALGPTVWDCAGRTLVAPR
jgi:hypothetical protein